MALPTGPDIDSLTYPHDDHLHRKWHHFDRLLNRMPPISSISPSPPLLRNLGTLIILPNELLYEILSHLSITDLMCLRHCTRFASHIVDTIPLMRKILRIAPNTVKGMIAIRDSTCRRVTPARLFRKLCQRECDGCGELAQSIYLPTCVRACFNCSHRHGGRYFKVPAAYDELRGNFNGLCARIDDWPRILLPLCISTNGVDKCKTTER